ncbi:MAG: NAD(P)/FAD-dependent oxidoreductase, partial [Pseudomonadota bacterium]
TLIVGGGLSGLGLAERLESMSQDYGLLEARDRLGGRILTEKIDQGNFDLGPAWFWPGQPRMAALIQRFGLAAFDQYAAGDLLFEDEQGRVQRGLGYASMRGSLRLKGGMDALIQAVSKQIPPARIQLNARVMHLERDDDACRVTLLDGRTLEAERVVLALPPRIAAALTYTPALADKAQRALAETPTWMASQAKAVAVFDRPFWRSAGLSGDAMSRRGPMVEIHDASPAHGGPYALFGFIGVPSNGRADEDHLQHAIRAQLARLFGKDAADPQALLIKDWMRDPLTATPADAVQSYGHPAYGLPSALQHLWDGRLLLAGTEVANTFGGYLEGALEAAEAAWMQISAHEAAFS